MTVLSPFLLQSLGECCSLCLGRSSHLFAGSFFLTFQVLKFTSSRQPSTTYSLDQSLFYRLIYQPAFSEPIGGGGGEGWGSRHSVCKLALNSSMFSMVFPPSAVHGVSPSTSVLSSPENKLPSLYRVGGEGDRLPSVSNSVFSPTFSFTLRGRWCLHVL